MVCSLHPERLPRAPAATTLSWGMVRGLEGWGWGADGKGKGGLLCFEARQFYRKDLFEEARQSVMLLM